ncbi:MAG: histidine phosphatase family protein [Sneathiella sp.]|nr:histidine phosphatase family protein [Sneathiella sp.]
MIPILFIRHGRTSWNADKKLQGRRDIPLSDEGRLLLKTLALPIEFSNYSWVSSPLSRAVETAKMLGADDLTIEDQLIEMDWGEWEGQRVKDLQRRLGAKMAKIESQGLHMKPPGGESPANVQHRLLPWIARVKEPTIAVTHKGVIRAIKSLAYNWDMTDKSSVPFDWNCAHLFKINAQGLPVADRVNISLET